MRRFNWNHVPPPLPHHPLLPPEIVSPKHSTKIFNDRSMGQALMCVRVCFFILEKKVKFFENLLALIFALSQQFKYLAIYVLSKYLQRAKSNFQNDSEKPRTNEINVTCVVVESFSPSHKLIWFSLSACFHRFWRRWRKKECAEKEDDKTTAKYIS